MGHLDQASPEDALQSQLHVEVLGPTSHGDEEVGDIQAPVLGHELVDDTGGRILGDPDILQGNRELVRALCRRHSKRTLQGTRTPYRVTVSALCEGPSRGQKGNPARAGEESLKNWLHPSFSTQSVATCTLPAQPGAGHLEFTLRKKSTHSV